MTNNDKKWSEKEFEYYCIRCRAWIDFFGLKEWEVHFKFEEFNAEASIYYNCQTRFCLFRLRPTMPEFIVNDRQKEIDQCAFHEVCHLLIADFTHLCNERIVTENEIARQEETFVRRMENACFEKLR